MKKLKLLKFVPQLLIGVLALLFIATSAHASGLVRVAKSSFSAEMNARGLETFRGEVIGLREIQGALEVREILARPNIETKQGEIFYPEEIEFILIKAQQLRGEKERIPHGDE